MLYTIQISGEVPHDVPVTFNSEGLVVRTSRGYQFFLGWTVEALENYCRNYGWKIIKHG